MSSCLSEITLRSRTASGCVALGLKPGYFTIYRSPYLLSKPDKSPFLNILSIRPSLCWWNVPDFPSEMEKKSLSLLCEIVALLWTTSCEQAKPYRYYWPHRDKIYLNIFFPTSMQSLHWCCYKWLNIKCKQNFSGVRKVTRDCFIITRALTMWNLQGDENITIWTCSLNSTGTQRICHETYRRDGKKNTIRCSIIDQMCRWHGGEVVGCYYLWEISDSLT